MAIVALDHGPARAAEVGVVQIADLTFGNFVPLGAAVVIVPPSGFARYIDAVAATGGRASPARFELAGNPGEWVEVQLPPASVRIRFAGGGAMVRDFVVEAAADAGLTSLGGGRYRLRLDPGGARTLDIGGSLHLSGPSNEGTGSTRFSITITRVN